MRYLILTGIALALAFPGPRTVSAVGYKDEATLRSWDNEIKCTGERYWNAQRRRTWWTYGRPCALTYEQCVLGWVDDRDGAHKVTGCIPDDGNNSRGMEASY